MPLKAFCTVALTSLSNFLQDFNSSLTKSKAAIPADFENDVKILHQNGLSIQILILTSPIKVEVVCLIIEAVL